MAGRPKIKGGRRLPAVVMLTPKQYTLAKQAAKQAETSMSAWLAMLVADHFLPPTEEGAWGKVERPR